MNQSTASRSAKRSTGKRHRLWKLALLGSCGYYPVFAQQVFGPARLFGGEWGNIVWSGIMETWTDEARLERARQLADMKGAPVWTGVNRASQ